MKMLLALASILAASLTAPAFAATTVSSQATEVNPTLEELLAHSRVSIGQSRVGLLTEMREPDVVLSRNVWVYTGFRAANVSGAERFDALVVIFKNEKVDAIRLTTEERVQVVRGRSSPENTSVATNLP
jgi:hypothetical protein